MTPTNCSGRERFITWVKHSWNMLQCLTCTSDLSAWNILGFLPPPSPVLVAAGSTPKYWVCSVTTFSCAAICLGSASSEMATRGSLSTSWCVDVWKCNLKVPLRLRAGHGEFSWLKKRRPWKCHEDSLIFSSLPVEHLQMSDFHGVSDCSLPGEIVTVF